MRTEPIRVGVVGASPHRGWAAATHMPALQSLPQYNITAVATTRADSARESALQYGAAHAFTDGGDLCEHPDVELVVVAVKVPHHARLVTAALEAGKHVLCEWPLARTSEEAAGLVTAAHRAGVVNAVGLQARHAPAVVRARELIADGHVGRVTSVAAYSARGVAAGARLPAAFAYTLDESSGAGTLEVVGGHTLDTVLYVLGRELTALSASLSVQHPRITIEEDGLRREATSPDTVSLHGTVVGGAALAAHFHDAKGSGGRTRLEISGTLGDLAVVSSGPGGDRGLQIDDLALLGARRPEPYLSELSTSLPRPTPAGRLTPSQRVMALRYVALARDIRAGGRRVPDFADGLRLHRLLDAVRLSARAGRRLDCLTR